MDAQNLIYLAVQLIACVVAFYYWKYYKGRSMWIFLPFLVYSFINEIAATYMAIHYHSRVLYNIYTIISFLVYLYFFNKLLKLKVWKWVLLALFLLVYLEEILATGFIKPLMRNSIIVQSVLVLVFTVLYFVRLLQQDTVIHYYRLPEFWIVSGLLMFYIAFTPLMIFVGIGYNFQHIYLAAITVLNLVLYGTYIIGFYVSGKS